jgi:hypothetical protein
MGTSAASRFRGAPGFGGRGDRATGGTESFSSSFGDRGSRDRMGAESGGNRVDNDGKDKALNQANPTESVGALSLGGGGSSCCRKPLR